MRFDIRNVNLAALNSATKYPSIKTYHTLDPKNGWLSEPAVQFEGDVVLTEQIDGTNSRIILLPGGGYVLGSREDLLYARGDVIGNPAQGIVEALKDKAEELASSWLGACITTIFLETFGGKTSSGSKNYGKDHTSFRAFDIIDIEDYDELLSRPVEAIAAWRESGGQEYRDECWLRGSLNVFQVPGVPVITTVNKDDLPQTLGAANEFLRHYLPTTNCALQDDALRVPEGVVLRSLDRRTIAKMRYEDYERTFRRRNGTRRMR